MKYSQARSLIRTGDVYVAKGTWLISRGIQKVTGEDVSHTGIFVWACFGRSLEPRLCMFEAMEGRDVRIVPADYAIEHDYWAKGGDIFWQKIVDPEINGTKVWDFCYSHWGDGYANKYQFVVYMSWLLKYIRAKRGKSMDTNDTKWHCSELVSRGFEEQGCELPKIPALMSPGDVSRLKCLGARTRLTPE